MHRGLLLLVYAAQYSITNLFKNTRGGILPYEWRNAEVQSIMDLSTYFKSTQAPFLVLPLLIVFADFSIPKATFMQYL